MPKISKTALTLSTLLLGYALLAVSHSQPLWAQTPAATPPTPATAIIAQENSLTLIPLDTPTHKIILPVLGTPDTPCLSGSSQLIAYSQVLPDGRYNRVPLSLIGTGAGSQPFQITPDTSGYIWHGDQLLYSDTTQGLCTYDPKSGHTAVLGTGAFQYSALQLDSHGTLYAQKRQDYTKDGDRYSKNLGIIAYDLATGRERTLVADIPTDDTSLGLAPMIADLSADDRYLYVWCGVHSASTNTDGVPFGVYDLVQNTFTRYADDQVFLRKNPANIAINPTNSGQIVLTNGGNREEYRNKTLTLLNIPQQTAKPLLPAQQFAVELPYSTHRQASMVAMSPVFAPDGRTLVYSASPGIRDDARGSLQWYGQPHPLYQLDLADGTSSQLTHSTSGFDFALDYSRDGHTLYFLRQSVDQKDATTCALWQLSEQKETLIQDHISMSSVDYPSHLTLQK